MADLGRDEKLAVLNGLAGNYAATLAPETAKMWLFLLKDYSVQQTQAAALAMIRKYGTEAVPYRTMPPFALMQKELDAMTGTVRGEENVKLQARAEWGKLLSDVETFGAYHEPEMNRTTAYCVRVLGGWGQVCRRKMEELPFRERDFLQIWEQSHGKEEFLAIGSDAVKRLDTPAGSKAIDMKEFQTKKAQLIENFRPALQPLREPIRQVPERKAAVLDVTRLSPELRAAREALIAAKAERARAS